jgi:hypothetical protein
VSTSKGANVECPVASAAFDWLCNFMHKDLGAV